MILLKYLERVKTPLFVSISFSLIILSLGLVLAPIGLPLSYICIAITTLFPYYFFLSYTTTFTPFAKVLCFIPSLAIAYLISQLIFPHLLLFFNVLLPAAAFGILSVGVLFCTFELMLSSFKKQDFSIIKLIVHPSHRRVLMTLLNRANIERAQVENEIRAQIELALPKRELEILTTKQENLLKRLPKAALAIFDEPADSPKYIAQKQYLETLSEEQQAFHKAYLDLAISLSPKEAECCLSLQKPFDAPPESSFVIIEKLFKKNGIEQAVPSKSRIYEESHFLDGLSVKNTALCPTDRDPYFSPRSYPNPHNPGEAHDVGEPGCHPDTSCPTRYIYYPYTQVKGHTVSVQLCEAIENFLDPTLGKQRTDSLEKLSKQYKDQQAKARRTAPNNTQASSTLLPAPRSLSAVQPHDYRQAPAGTHRPNLMRTLFFDPDLRNSGLSDEELAVAYMLARVREAPGSSGQR